MDGLHWDAGKTDALRGLQGPSPFAQETKNSVIANTTDKRDRENESDRTTLCIAGVRGETIARGHQGKEDKRYNTTAWDYENRKILGPPKKRDPHVSKLKGQTKKKARNAEVQGSVG